MRTNVTSVAAPVCLLALLLAPAAGAQQHRASLRGAIVDPSMAPLTDVEVRVMSEATGDVRTVKSDGGGRFVMPELLPGPYRVEVRHGGYGPFLARVTLELNESLPLEIALQLGNLIQAVDVTAPTAAIDRDSAALGTFIDERQLAGLPLDGRNFLELALLAPGTAAAPQGSASSQRGDFAFSANGGREDFNAFLLDGVYNVDPKLNTPAVRPPVDGIREFSVLTSTYDASYGRHAGAQVNVVTRSGSNRASGTAYEFLRDRALNARNHFAPAGEPAPDYRRHQFGGSLGGPIVRDRAFFFLDYEGTRLREGITRVANVPTLAEREGDFSHTLFRTPVDPFTGQPFPGNQMPSYYLSPIGHAIAALYPAPNRGTPFENYVSSPAQRDAIDQFDARLDQSLAAGARVTARFSASDRRLFEPFAGPGFAAVPGFGTNVPRRGKNAVAGFTLAPASHLVNDMRLGYNRVSIGVFAGNTGVDNRSVGLKSLTSSPRDAGLSVITVSGYSPLGHEYTTPQESTSDVFQVSDTATWVRGAHLIKFGAEWLVIHQQAYRDVQSRGFLNFIDRGYTGNSLADLLMGLPVLTGGATLDNPQRLRTSSWSVFAGDEWRAGPSLTISIGLRYDYSTPPYDADNRVNVYDPATGALVQAGAGGLPRGGHEPDRNNLAPRVGFSRVFGKDSRMALRGGYGIYYNQGALATSEGLYFNPPYFKLNVFFPYPGLPPLTLSDPFPASFPFPIPQSATAYQRDLRTPWVEHWNLDVQQQFGRSRTIELAYTGSRGHDLISARDMNQATGSVRPNPAFADITLIESRATSRYDALQIKLQQRAADGKSALVSYTYSKSTDDASGFFTSAGDPNFPQNSLDPGAERGRSAFDVRHRFSMSGTYDLPFGTDRSWLANAGWVSTVLAELELQAVFTVQSGRPFTVALLPEIDNSLSGRSNLGFGYNDRPHVVGNPETGTPSIDRWFDTGAFALPPSGTFGNARRNALTGPRYQNINVALIKHVRLAPTSELQLRLEAFNLTNHLNLDLPDAFFGSPTFGRILSAQSARRIQLGARLAF